MVPVKAPLIVDRNRHFQNGQKKYGCCLAHFESVEFDLFSLHHTAYILEEEDIPLPEEGDLPLTEEDTLLPEEEGLSPIIHSFPILGFPVTPLATNPI